MKLPWLTFGVVYLPWHQWGTGADIRYGHAEPRPHMVITHHVEFPPMLCRDGVQQKQVKVRGGIRWIITTEKTREIRCSHCNRLLAKGECSILSGNAPVRDPLHTVCHSILYSKFFIPKLNGVVHKIVWRVTYRAGMRGTFRSRAMRYCIVVVWVRFGLRGTDKK